MDKVLYFNYFISSILRWSNSPINDLSKVKLFKLLFLTVAVSCNKDEDGLLTEFDNFWAFPYGPVEVDIYEQLSNLGKYEFEGKGIVEKDSSQILIPEIIKSKIDSAVAELKNINPNLVNYEAFMLVDITHLWNSWILSYNYASRHGQRSAKMPNELIKADNKIFTIHTHEHSLA